MPVIVEKAYCPQNHACPAIKRCPVGAISQKGFNAPVVDNEKCISCGKCTSFCPMRALKLTKGNSSKNYQDTVIPLSPFRRLLDTLKI